MKIILKKKFDQTVQKAWNSLEKKKIISLYFKHLIGIKVGLK